MVDLAPSAAGLAAASNLTEATFDIDTLFPSNKTYATYPGV